MYWVNESHTVGWMLNGAMHKQHLTQCQDTMSALAALAALTEAVPLPKSQGSCTPRGGAFLGLAILELLLSFL